MANNNWSPDLQTWIDILNTPMSTLKKLSTSFTKAQMSTVNMNGEELVCHREALRLIETDLHFATRNVAEVQDNDDE
jgi:hypothetical protein